MVGITGFGSYLPYFRFERKKWVEAWGMDSLASLMIGERTVANFDEDTVTMAVEAALDCLNGADPKNVGALYFASTTSPYAEKLCASLISRVCDLDETIRTADFAGSLRSGTSALMAALDLVKSGGAKNAIVTAADIRLSDPRHYMEAMMGDCAGAIMVGDENVLLELDGMISLAREFTDTWRRSEEQTVRYGEEKFSSVYGYMSTVPKALAKLLETTKTPPEKVAKVVVYAPEGASYMALAKRSGFPQLFNQDPLLMNAGNAGSASVLLQLAQVIPQLKPGDKLVAVGYGEGADAFLFTATDKVSQTNGHAKVGDWVKSKAALNHYPKILYYREQLKRQTPLFEFNPYTSLAEMRKEETEMLPLYGQKCSKCGEIIYPLKRVCPYCHAKDAGEPFKLAHKGKVFSFVKDHVFPNPESPTPMVVIDLDGGGRMLCQMTDFAEKDLEVGMEVELTYRKIHEGRGFNNYFWKARPTRVSNLKNG